MSSGGCPSPGGSGLEIGYAPRADVLVSTEAEIAAARKSLTGVLRTAVEAGVTVYQAGERRPYRKRPRPAGLDERIDPAEAANEACRLLSMGAMKLDRAEFFLAGNGLESQRTEIAGASRKAIEFALQAVIVSRGQRPRGWKNAASLADEARNAGARPPEPAPGALERTTNHYAGRAYPGYAVPDADETVEAIETARLMVAWAQRQLAPTAVVLPAPAGE